MTLQEFASNPWLVLTGYLFGVVGLVLTVLQLSRNPLRKKLCFKVKGSNIISPKAERTGRLAILFNNAPITTLSESILFFWNDGNVAITYTDVPESGAIRVVVPKDRIILSCEVLAVDSPGVGLDTPTETASSEVMLKVNRIERGRGAVLKVLHTSSNPQDAQLVGYVTDYGAPQLRQKAAEFDGLMFGIAAIISAVGSAILAHLANGVEQGNFLSFAGVMFFGIPFLIFLVSSSIWMPRIRNVYWRKVYPQSFVFYHLEYR